MRKIFLPLIIIVSFLVCVPVNAQIGPGFCNASAGSIAITSSTGNGCPGNNSTLLTLSGPTVGSIQWIYSLDGIDWVEINGATGTQYWANDLTVTTRFAVRATFTGISGTCSDLSNIIIISIATPVWYKDVDDDDYSDGTTLTQCADPGANYKSASQLTATSGDCNDNNPSAHPGALEVFDGVDNNCDGAVDEGFHDYIIPAGISSISLTVQGAKGGSIKRQDVHGTEPIGSPVTVATGGGGARLNAKFKIETDCQQGLKPGGKLRMIIGATPNAIIRNQQVPSLPVPPTSFGQGGGGGTAILYQAPGTSSWVVLAVAGGGGGAFSRADGLNSLNSNGITAIQQSFNANTTGPDGMGGAGFFITQEIPDGDPRDGGLTVTTNISGGGGGSYGDATQSCGGKKGIEEGGTSTVCVNGNRGGYGFGAGGSGMSRLDNESTPLSEEGGGGGGGGYSGGNGGVNATGGFGGGSYISDLAFESSWLTSSSVEDGSISIVTSSAPACCDPAPPVFSGVYTTIDLGINPTAEIIGAQLGTATATDGCGTPTVTSTDGAILSEGCSRSQTRTFTAEDAGGSTTTASRTVIWTEDITVPTVTKGSIASCYKTVADAENAAKTSTTYSDNCSANELLVVSAQTAGTCNATITITVTDAANNSSSVTYTSKIDNAAPVLSSYPENVRLNCQIPIFPVTVTASDNCDGNVNVALNETNTRGSDPTQSSYFNYTVTRTWSASDACGNTVAHTQVITVEDKTPPELICPGNMTVSTEAGLCYADVTFNVTAVEFCGIPITSYYLYYGTDEQQPIGSPWRFNVGSYTVTVVSSDVSGNSSSCTIAVTVSDGEKPTVVTKNITVQLDASGNATISNSAVNDGSSDNCTQQANLIFETNIKSFTCSNIGANTVILKVTDASGNTAMANATVTVEDKAKPNVITKNITVYLDGTGNATIADNAVNNGSSDNCTPQANLIFETNIKSFTCSTIGANTVVLIVTDGSGNTSTANATVTVEDQVKPNAITKNITVYLDGTGNATIADNAVNNGSSDNCTPQTSLIFETNIKSFTCSTIGANTVVLKVTDGSGNTSTANATVTVEDKVKPNVITKSIIVYLDGTGNATIADNTVNNGSSDNCTPQANLIFETNIKSFTCSTIGINTVVLKVTDGSGNTSTASATVTVEDKVKPTVATKNIIVYLDGTGNITITNTAVNNGSSDNCTPQASLIFETNIKSFTCANIGDNTVTLKVTDGSGNTASASATVTVRDNLVPTANCKNITVYLGANGQVTIAAADVNNNSTDNCTSPAQLGLSINRTTFNSDDLGSDCLKAFNVTLTVTDGSGNISTCTSSVTLKRRITKLVYNGATEAQYSDPANLSATLYDITEGEPGVVLANKTVKFTIGAQSVSDTYGGVGGGTNGSGIANGTIVLNQDPTPGYTIVSNFAGDAVYCTSSSSLAFDIKPEDICAEYNGQLSVAATVLSKTSNTAKVVMSVGLADDEDSNSGDVTKAKVEFNYGSGWVTVPVQALNTAKTLGNATLTVIINFSGDASTLGFEYRISAYYQIDQDCSDNGQSVINVYKPQGEFITGGGYIVPTNASVGIMPADPARKANFGFNVKYNQKNTNLQGNINYIFRRKENGVVRLYQVKGNSMTSLTVNMNDAAEGGTKTAVFVGKCNVTDVTNPAAPVPVPNTGNSIMQVIVTDASESGATDKYGITVWNSSNQLFHSSNWESTKTTKLVLRGGNIVVSGTTSSPLTRAATSDTEPSPSGVNKSAMIEKTEAPVEADKLNVVAMPNPSSTNFRIAITSDNAKDPVQMIVTDMMGRIIESRKITAGQVITIGDKYISGTYAMRIIQGRKIRQLTLIKISD